MHNLRAALLLAPLAASVAVADPDYDFDRDEVPPPCRDICQPMVELTNRCDDFDFPGDDRTEDRLERQCVCTNESFDVPRVAALCASCFEQNRDWRGNDPEDDDFDDDDDDDDDWDEDDWEPKYIGRIMRDCGFSSVSYSASAHSTVASTISVSASRFTETAQLTTTIDPARSTGDSNDGGNNGGGGNDGGNNGGGNNDGDDDADRNNDDDGGDSGNSNNDGDDDDAAASLGLSLFAVVGAAVAGGFFLA